MLLRQADGPLEGFVKRIQKNRVEKKQKGKKFV